MKMYAFANCNEYKVLKRKATSDMSFRSGNIEITDTELIVYGYYFCFGSCSAKRISLSDIRAVKEIETHTYNSKTCGAACTTTWWHCDPTNGCFREFKNMKGLVVEGESFSIGLTLAAHSDYEHVKQLLSLTEKMLNVGAEIREI